MEQFVYMVMSNNYAVKSKSYIFWSKNFDRKKRMIYSHHELVKECLVVFEPTTARCCIGEHFILPHPISVDRSDYTHIYFTYGCEFCESGCCVQFYYLKQDGRRYRRESEYFPTSIYTVGVNISF